MDKIRLGVLGAGSMGKRVAAAAVRTSLFEVVSIADSNRTLATELADEYGATVHDELQSLCAAGDLDAVYVGLPHNLHADACIAASRADLHVLVDKPLCNTIAEADQIRDAASGSTRTWMVGFSYRFRAEWQRAESLISAGEIGTPYFVSDVIVEAYEHLSNWYLDTTAGGGVLQIQSHHSFDRLAWLFKTAPTEIACRVAQPSVPVDLAVQVTAVYPPGIVAGISLALGHGYDSRPRMLLVVQGDRGMLEIDETRTLRFTTSRGTTIESYADDDWLDRELTVFGRAVSGADIDFPGIEEGRAALQCALAANRAATWRGWVALGG